MSDFLGASSVGFHAREGQHFNLFCITVKGQFRINHTNCFDVMEVLESDDHQLFKKKNGTPFESVDWGQREVPVTQ